MDPITGPAIFAALSAIFGSGVSEIGKQAIVDAYNGLKGLLKKRFGEQSKLVASVELLEKDPQDDSVQAIIQNEVKKAKADDDEEIRQAAQSILDQVKTIPEGEKHIQQAIGKYIAQADRHSKASVSVNKSPKQKKTDH